MYNVSTMFEDLKEKGLLQEEFPESTTLEDYLEATQRLAPEDPELKELALRWQTSELIEGITLQDIVNTNFTNSKQTIDQMPLAKRIELLEELHKYRDYLYECASRYGAEGLPREEQLSASDFRIVLGRIKHLEIVQNWLYGVI